MKLAKSPLHEWHIEHGATIMWDDGYPWTLIQGNDYMKEYEAVRTATGLLDLFSLFVYEIKGPEANKFIQRTFTNLVDSMEIGQVRYGAFVDHRGILMDEGSVCKFNQDRFLVMANGPNIQRQMSQYAQGLEASISNITNQRATIGVQGPTSLETLQPFVNKDLSQLKFFRFYDDLTIADCKGWVSRTGYSGEKGYEINVAPEDALKVWNALVEAGGVPFGVYAIEILRVEAGLPLIYIDYRLNDLSPFDLSMDNVIKFHPDCVGTEALKIYQQELPRRYKTVTIKGDELPDFHTGIFVDKEPVGLIKSPAKSPLCGSIALAMIDTPYAIDGTKVEVMVAGKFIPAEVGPLCIFDPEKKRIRT